MRGRLEGAANRSCTLYRTVDDGPGAHSRRGRGPANITTYAWRRYPAAWGMERRVGACRAVADGL